MIKKILPIALLGLVLFNNTGCKSGGGDMKKIKGIEYKIVKDAPGKNAAVGDVVEYNMIAKVDTVADQALILNDTWKQGRPGVLRVEPVKNSGDFMAVIPMLSAGDSALVEISCDTILNNVPADQMQSIPSWLKKGNKVKLVVSVISIKSMDEYKKEMEGKQAAMQKEMQEKAAAQMPVDDKLLQDYFAKNNIKAQKTASGLYYTISQPGSGENAKPGQMVSMKYIGKTLEGKQFDANMDESGKLKGDKPFTFPLGQGQVIKGWDEGVALLKKGSKAIFYIPSPLAYGPQAQGPDLPGNSILVFNVEVVDIKAAPPAAENPQMQAPQQ
jgi:FKBP-type peptidyl-prolyl cis-trans isomerase FkpA